MENFFVFQNDRKEGLHISFEGRGGLFGIFIFSHFFFSKFFSTIPYSSSCHMAEVARYSTRSRWLNVFFQFGYPFV